MYKILIIEDELGIRESVCELLDINGYQTESASNGYLGLKKAIEILPDLVICDVLMPNFNGWETLEVFRHNKLLQAIPFIFLTAKVTMQDLRKGMNLGADDYLTKPFLPQELLNVIARQLEKIKIGKTKEASERLVQIKKAVAKIVFKEKKQNIEFHQSLEYAKRVQDVILPNESTMQNLFENYFGYFSAKDVISGDFFWVKEIGGVKLIAVADCTGHGVPAALLTMICYEQLNLTVSRYGCRNPEDILKKVNDLIVCFMKQNGDYELNDGMDISLCSIDTDYNILRFAGAVRPLYIVSDNLKFIKVDDSRVNILTGDSGKKLYEIKGDRNSIGGGYENFTINEQVIELKNDDLLYLFSDGLIDQFGGENKKRFKSKQLKQLILGINERDLSGQKSIIANTINTWKGPEEQTDDIALIGIRL